VAERFKHATTQPNWTRLRGAISQQLKPDDPPEPAAARLPATVRKLIDDTTAASRNVEQVYQELLALVKALNQEEQRHLAEGLTEEELALFDLLVNKPEIKLAQKRRQAVKKAAHELLSAQRW